MLDKPFPESTSCELPGQPRESFRPFGPEVSQGESPPKTGLSDGLSHGVFPGPLEPQAQECPTLPFLLFVWKCFFFPCEGSLFFERLPLHFQRF